jgi:glycerol kinase
MSILVVDVGTSGVRAAIVRPDATVAHVHHLPVLPTTPSPGFVEFDPVEMAAAAMKVARAALAADGPVDAVGITNQRASTIVWERHTGEPIGPGIGWQDLRTVGTCLMLQGQGFRIAPNASATKLSYLLDTYDYERKRDLVFGTVDSWIAWHLSEGTAHVTDASNAAVTGLLQGALVEWSAPVMEALRIPEQLLPAIVDSSGFAGEAVALDGRPPILGIAGDQQASLIGQGCTRPGLAKITCGTGGMLDVCVGPERPAFAVRGDGGSFPIIAWQRAGAVTWGLEAIALSAGSAVEWLRDDLGLIASAEESEPVAAACDDAGGVFFVPALLGLGTPHWDFGARGTLVGLTRGTGRAEVVRAVLEGVAHRGADLLEAAEVDGGLRCDSLRVDGGMSANGVFVQALADATGRPVEVSPELEATTLGAGYLAGMAAGLWKDEEEVAGAWSPARVVEPARQLDRQRWAAAVERARRWIPELSALDF